MRTARALPGFRPTLFVVPSLVLASVLALAGCGSSASGPAACEAVPCPPAVPRTPRAVLAETRVRLPELRGAIARHLRFLDACHTVQAGDDYRRNLTDQSVELDDIEAEIAKLETDSYSANDPPSRRRVADGADALAERVRRINVRVALMGDMLRDCPPPPR